MDRTCVIILFATCAWGARANRHVLMGLDTADVTAKLAFNFKSAKVFAAKQVSLHIVVPSVGRRSIFRLLSSLKPQLEPQDHITVIFDGVDYHSIFDEVNRELAGMPGRAPFSLAHAILCKTNIPVIATDMVASAIAMGPRTVQVVDRVSKMHQDDDNHYTADALSTIRRLVQHDHEALYIFQMQRTKDLIIPRLGDERVVIGNVDSGCGVVPSKYAHLADWTTSKNAYEADGHYFHELSELMPRTYFMNKVIYLYSEANMGRDV